MFFVIVCHPFMCFAVIFYMIKKKTIGKGNSNYYLAGLLPRGGSIDSNALSLASFEKLPYNTRREISRTTFVIKNELGSGNFGKVFKGELYGLYGSNSKTTVAIKSVNGEGGTNAMHDLLCEIKLMSYIQAHPNLVSMIGSCRSESDTLGKLWLLIEYCEYGDMKKFLTDQKFTILFGKEEALNDRCLLKWAHGVCKGMQHLAENKIMHGDLAARNILMGEDILTNGCPVAKIADFGLSKHFYEDVTYEKTSRLFVPWKWMAIEYLKDEFFTLKSDVWSFAVLFWEILSFGKTPYGPQEYEEVLKKLENGYRLPCPNEVERISSWNPIDLYTEISNRCFVADPKSRANFDDIVELLEKNLSDDEKKRYVHMNELYQKTRAENYLKIGTR